MCSIAAYIWATANVLSLLVVHEFILCLCFYAALNPVGFEGRTLKVTPARRNQFHCICTPVFSLLSSVFRNIPRWLGKLMFFYAGK